MQMRSDTIMCDFVVTLNSKMHLIIQSIYKVNITALICRTKFVRISLYSMSTYLM